MKTTKRLTIIFLVFLLITSIGFTTSVSAGSLLEDKLEQIKSVYSDGKYFTRSGNICNSNQSSDCELNNIPSRGGLPSGSQVASVCGDAWSCCSFAKYVFYCLFEISPLDSSYTNVSNLKQGDYIKFYSSTYGEHYGIYLDEDASNWYVYDSNYTFPASNRIRYYGAISKSGTYIKEARHANNYDQINTKKHWYDNISPVNLGDEFYAKIKNKYMGTYISVGNRISDSAFDAIGKTESGENNQIWHFIRLSDGSYAIRNADNNFSLDIEAGNNINNLSVQPNGTNVQLYSTYNETSNQKFFVYNIFDSFYIRPVGTDKVIDLSLSNNCVTIYDYAENFDPQKFDIVKIDLKNNIPVNLGNRFYALIKNKKTENLISEGGNISKYANDVIGKPANNDENQIWLFNRNSDGSYSIKNLKSNMYLDVEAGYNIDDLLAQPNGTNVQTYYKYNGTGNQKFYIYRMFNSYYIKPVGMNRIVDMGIDNCLVAVWDYGDDFAPQKFDIIRIDVNNTLPSDLGDEFYAIIKNIRTNNVFTMTNSLSKYAYDIKGEEYNNSDNQIWEFIKESDGSYLIQNTSNGYYLDVEAGFNIDNLSAQPNGTNIQAYYKYNGTTNQKFYIYKLFDAYYIKPAGTQKMVDMGLSNGLVAIWEYADDFAPQKFDIIKIKSKNHLIGDVNLDGEITITDATEIQKYITKIITFSEEQMNLADINRDGSLDVSDSTYLQKYIVGIDNMILEK